MVDLPQGLTSLFLTYLFFLIVIGVSAVALGARAGKFILGFTLVFWISYACWVAGHYAYIAATPDKLKSLGLGIILLVLFVWISYTYFPGTH